jgi:hypothetical protein
VLFISFYIIVFAKLNALESKRDYFLKLMNEFFFLIIQYHLFCFSNFMILQSSQFRMGWSFLICLGVMLLINMGVISVNVTNKIRKQKRSKNM